jgi:hypothetical protein
MTKTVVDAEVLDIEVVADALRTSPHGVCVYEAGNDVVDHQTVTLEYEGGVTASVVMSACQFKLLSRNRSVSDEPSFRGGMPALYTDSRD